MTDKLREEIEKCLMGGFFTQRSYSSGLHAGLTDTTEVTPKTEAVDALVNLIASREQAARVDTISDMIIECYNHDNPLEIAKELEEERRRLELTNPEGSE